MNQYRANRVARASHGLFLLLCVGCLIFFGILANSPSISVKAVKAESSDQRTCSIDINCLPDCDGAMAKGSASAPGKVFYITIPAVLSGDGPGKRLPIQKIIEIRTSPRIIHGQDALLYTAVTVCPHKAREFTLIGAKPSGTS